MAIDAIAAGGAARAGKRLPPLRRAYFPRAALALCVTLFLCAALLPPLCAPGLALPAGEAQRAREALPLTRAAAILNRAMAARFPEGVSVARVLLRSWRVPCPETPGRFVRIPVWQFFGARGALLLTVNALNGEIISRGTEERNVI